MAYKVLMITQILWSMVYCTEHQLIHNMALLDEVISVGTEVGTSKEHGEF